MDPPEDRGAGVASRLLKQFRKLDADGTGTASLEDVVAVIAGCDRGRVCEEACRRFLSSFRYETARGIDYEQLLRDLYGCDRQTVVRKPDNLIQVQKLCDPSSHAMRILKLEDRAITLPQLQSLWEYVEGHCEAQGWTSSKPEAEDGALCKDTIDFYDVQHWVVKPATRMQQCSYVELVATGAQRPLWFAAHAWGCPLCEFQRCLRQHQEDRMLPNDAAYWIYAFAKSPWCASEEASRDPAQPSVWRALVGAQGTVSVVDGEGILFSRVWCAYEMFVAMTWTPGSHLRDIYTAYGHTGKAVGLTDGVVAVDTAEADEELAPLNNKLSRERGFPVGLAAKSLEMDIHRMRASHTNDWRHILNAIANVDELGGEPPAEHSNYDKVARLLRGFVAVRCWRLALESSSPDIGRFSQALRESDLERVELQLHGLERLTGNMEEFVKALPVGRDTRSLSLQFGLLRAADATSFARGVGQLRQLRSLTCDLIGTFRGPESAKEVFLEGLRQLHQLNSLTLRLYRNTLGVEGATALASALRALTQLTSLRLVLCDTSFGESCRVLAAALGDLRRLTNLSLWHCNDDLGVEGASALAAALAELQLVRKLRLVLSNTALGEEGGGILAAALGNMTQLASLELDLNNNALGAAGGDALAAALQKLQLTKIQLDLRSNSLSAEATSTLSSLAATAGGGFVCARFV